MSACDPFLVHRPCAVYMFTLQLIPYLSAPFTRSFGRSVCLSICGCGPSLPALTLDQNSHRIHREPTAFHVVESARLALSS